MNSYFDNLYISQAASRNPQEKIHYSIRIPGGCPMPTHQQTNRYCLFQDPDICKFFAYTF